MFNFGVKDIIDIFLFALLLYYVYRLMKESVGFGVGGSYHCETAIGGNKTPYSLKKISESERILMARSEPYGRTAMSRGRNNGCGNRQCGGFGSRCQLSGIAVGFQTRGRAKRQEADGKYRLPLAHIVC